MEIVIGLPLTLAGESRQQAGKVRSFVRELRSKTDLAVTTVDERLSTVQAQRMLRESGSGRRGRDRGQDRLGRGGGHSPGVPGLAGVGYWGSAILEF